VGIAQKPRFGFVHREMLAEARFIDLFLQLLPRPSILLMDRAIRIRKARPVEVDDAYNGDDFGLLQSKAGSPGKILHIVAHASKINRFDCDSIRQFGLYPPRQKFRQVSLGFPFDEKDDPHKTASASPEKANLPRE
jgi:hypothetical protein